MLGTPRGTSIPMLLAGAAVLAAGGCGEDRNYHAGLAESAALDEAAYKSEAAGRAEAAGKAERAAAGLPSGPRSSPDAGVSAAASRFGSDAPSSSSGVAGDSEPRSVAAELFEPDGINPSEAGEDAVRIVAEELSLPSPPPVAETPGEEPYQKLARDRKFDEFRRKAARYVQLKKQLFPLGRKLADGSATTAERALHNRLEDAIAVEFKPLNRYLWDERWTEADRAAMGWILFVKPD